MRRHRFARHSEQFNTKQLSLWVR
ncbi:MULTISPECIES: hypothetical protein [Pseudomonas aeruginosa group]